MTKPRRFWGIILILSIMLVSALPWWPFNFCSFSICDTCAVTRSRREWQLPYLDTTWRTTFGEEHPTALNRLLVEFGRVSPHSHTWRFVRGAGNGVQCAIGNGRYIFDLTREDRVLDFLRFLKEKESPEFLDSWIALALDHRTAWQFRSLLCRIEAYPSREHAWWNVRYRMEEDRIAVVQDAARYPR